MTSKERVLAALGAFRTRDAAEIAEHFAPDAEWVVPPGNATAIALGVPAELDRLRGRQAIAGFIARDVDRLFVADIRADVTRVLAEGEAVVVEWRFSGTLCNGRAYANDYCFVFTLRDGLIGEMREYMDTAAGFRMIFGEEPPRRLA